jgi:hypothetical protein
LNIDLASATAAYEHEELAAPNPQAFTIVRGLSSGKSRDISSFETTACTTALNKNPSTSAHKISHPIVNAIISACPIAGSMSISSEAIPAMSPA